MMQDRKRVTISTVLVSAFVTAGLGIFAAGAQALDDPAATPATPRPQSIGTSVQPAAELAP